MSSNPTSTKQSMHSHNQNQNLAAQIRDLLPLPRHAIFHVQLIIHQLQSVPFIDGEFRIKWKFRHLQAVNSAGRPLGLGRAIALKLEGGQKRKHEAHSAHGKGKGKERDILQDDEILHTEEPEDIQNVHRPALSSRVVADDYESFGHSHSKNGGASSSNSESRQDTPISLGNGIDYLTEARGYTPFLPLKDFKVNFESQINVAVQMSIEKDTLALLPSELKLTVMQRVIPGDPGAPTNPRLGHVQINLAEYANVGPVTRKYLLRRSKVNAMLNMTINMTQISGEENYRAPPLRKEAIKAGISAYLTTSEVPLPTLNRYLSTDDPWLMSTLGQFVPLNEEVHPAPEEPSDISFEVPRPESRTKKRWRVGGGGKRRTTDLPLPLPSKLPPQRQQLHPTEALIEAIFNPYPSISLTPSPFTYYVPPPPPPPLPPPSTERQYSDNGTDGTSRGSFDSSRRTSASASEQGHDGGSSSGAGSLNGNGNGGRWWRRKTSSRPVTPART